MGTEMASEKKPVFPRKLRHGSHVRVIAPSRSLRIIGEATRRTANQRLAQLGLRVSFGRHVDEVDDFSSSPAAHRVDDLHEAFADDDVDGVLTVIGGYNANELLPLIDWKLIGGHPKVLCGFSDITILQLAMFRMTGLVTYSGPHYSTFGMEQHFDQTLDWFRSCLFDDAPLSLAPSETWSDDLWFADQDSRRIEPNEGWWTLRPGDAIGPILGGNLDTISLLFGTGLLPELGGALLWIEDDAESPPWTFRRRLTALSQQPGFDRIAGLVIGRFQRESGVTEAVLRQILEAVPLPEVPVLANVDFGHTDPMVTFPIGGTARLEVDGTGTALRLERH